MSPFKISILIPLLLVPVLLSGQDPLKNRLATRYDKNIDVNNVLADYPRPQLMREDWINLNGYWDYSITGKDQIKSPDNYELKILVPYPPESYLSGAGRILSPDEYLWYRHKFTLPPTWNNRQVILHFGAVDWEATVYINGKEAATHRGGYDGFSINITPYLEKDGEQEIIIRVWDPTDTGRQPIGKQRLKPGGIWYTPSSGIWQTVWLENTGNDYVTSLLMVPDIDKQQLRIRVNTNNIENSFKVIVKAFLNGHAVSDIQGQANSDLIMQVPGSELWSPENPVLYDLKVFLSNDGKILDSISSYFGMRKIEIRTVEGFKRIFLNNREFFQVGPLDQGYWPDGIYTAPTDEALKNDLVLTKSFGFNMSRKHTKVEPERWYYWADRLGLLVWQDIPSMKDDREPDQAAKVQFKTELTNIVNQHINHPSVIMWVVFNEGWGQHDTEDLTEYTMKLDPSRLVSCASGWNDYPTGHIKDVHSYPAPSCPKPDTARASVLGEFWGVALPVTGHMWDTASWGYVQVKNKKEFELYYDLMMQKVYKYRKEEGLNAAVVTQITDVEKEINGLVTYDREVIKPEPDRIRKSNTGEHINVNFLLPTSEAGKQDWNYSFSIDPSDSLKWFQHDYNDDNWLKGTGGFGEEGTPGTHGILGTKWTEGTIYLRRDFYMPDIEPGKKGQLKLWLFHDDEAEVYINGIFTGRYKGWTTGYIALDLSPESLQSLQLNGINNIAIKCTDTGYGNFIDAGIIHLGE